MQNKKLNNRLKEQAERNTNVSLNKETVKRGVPLDHTVKHSSYEGATFGMSLGSTVNMDNYESLRVDCWLTDEVHKGETITEAYERVQEVLEKQLESVVAQYK